MQRILVERYSLEIEQIGKNLNCLDKQTANLTAGDLNIVKKRDGKIQFNANLDPQELIIKTDKKESNKNKSIDDPEEIKERNLKKTCFNKKNKSLLGII